MEELRLGDQLVRFDHDATVAAYALMPQGDGDRCGCVHCRNFAAQRGSIYPPNFRLLLAQIGIDPAKEGEVFDMVGPFNERLRPTGGWFYFVGEFIERGEKRVDEGEFQYWFQPSFPRPPDSFGQSVVAIEFSVRVPWVLDEDPY